MVSLPRRRLPAAVMLSTPGVSFRYSISSAATRWPKLSRKRPALWRYCAIDLQDLLFELGAHARQLAQLLLAADALQIVDGADVVVLEQQRDALRAQALDLQQLERAGRILLEQLIALLERCRARRFLSGRQPNLCRCRECR